MKVPKTALTISTLLLASPSRALPFPEHGDSSSLVVDRSGAVPLQPILAIDVLQCPPSIEGDVPYFVPIGSPINTNFTDLSALAALVWTDCRNTTYSSREDPLRKEGATGRHDSVDQLEGVALSKP